MIDGCLWALSWLHPGTFAARLGLTALSAVVTAFGVSIEVAANAWMLSAEMTVAAFSKVLRKPFGPVKVVMDTLVVVVSAALEWDILMKYKHQKPYTSLKYPIPFVEWNHL